MKRTIHFHLGKNINLSIAEIMSVFAYDIDIIGLTQDNKILKATLLLNDEEIRAKIKDLGGTTKISEEILELPQSISLLGLVREISKFVINDTFSNQSKAIIGLNKFNTSLPLKKIGFELKQELTEQDKKARIVNRDNNSLNSVSIIRNKIIKKGVDINLVQDGNLFITKTIGIQNSLDYSKRDYDRPRRNAKNGMLPPKLAQIMINMSKIKSDEKLLDPFCGSGTVGQEALLRNIDFYMSDINELIVQDSKENISWALQKLLKDYETSLDHKIKTCDATKLEKIYKGKQFDAIITEGALGPPLNSPPSTDQILAIFKKLNKVNVQFLESAKKLLKDDKPIVMTLPVIVNRENKLFHLKHALLPQIQKSYREVEMLDKNLININSLLKSNSLHFIYERPDQIVKREVVILKKLNI